MRYLLAFVAFIIGSLVNGISLDFAYSDKMLALTHEIAYED